MAIELDADTEHALEHALQDRLGIVFSDEEVGELRTQQIYDFVLTHVGPMIYNQAISDAQAWMQEKVLDLEGDLHEQVGDG